MISEATVKRLQEVLERKYGRKISADEAREILRSMVGYFDTLAKVYNREKMEEDKKGL